MSFYMVRLLEREEGDAESMRGWSMSVDVSCGWSGAGMCQ